MKHAAHFVGAVFLFVVSTAQSATVSLTPQSLTVSPGGQAVIDVMSDFGSTLVGDGSFGVIWPDFLGDPSFQFDQAIIDNADISGSLPGSAAFAVPNGITLGPGSKIGTFTFPVLNLGSGAIMFDPSSEFRDLAGALIDVTSDATQVASVPLPAAAWLLVSGLGLLMLGSKTRKTLPASATLP